MTATSPAVIDDHRWVLIDSHVIDLISTRPLEGVAKWFTPDSSASATAASRPSSVVNRGERPRRSLQKGPELRRETLFHLNPSIPLSPSKSCISPNLLSEQSLASRWLEAPLDPWSSRGPPPSFLQPPRYRNRAGKSSSLGIDRFLIDEVHWETWPCTYFGSSSSASSTSSSSRWAEASLHLLIVVYNR
jgi:hypothetical protein